MQTKSILLWILRVVPAVILLQTLYYKFGGHPESVDLFTQLGVEPWGRYGTGIIELVAGILLLIPKFTRFGAILSLGLMSGAIGSHLLILGIEHAGDGGILFIMAIVVFVLAAILTFLHKDELLADLKTIAG